MQYIIQRDCAYNYTIRKRIQILMTSCTILSLWEHILYEAKKCHNTGIIVCSFFVRRVEATL